MAPRKPRFCRASKCSSRRYRPEPHATRPDALVGRARVTYRPDSGNYGADSPSASGPLTHGLVTASPFNSIMKIVKPDRLEVLSGVAKKDEA
jgi:hypothetical protein